MRLSRLEETFALHVRAAKLPEPEREYRFAAVHVGMGTGLRRRLTDAKLSDWRFDFAWPQHQIAVEIEGGTWSGGRHTRGAGFAEDCRKYNAAQALCWRVFRATGEMVKSGEIIVILSHALQ